MLYRIAEVIVEINPKYEYSRSILEPYRCGGTEKNFSISASDERIAYILGKNPALTPAKAEQICLADNFCRAIMYFGGVFLHASAIAFRGRAYLFSAASGIGKSTHTSLWQKKFGEDKVVIINDDRPIIRIKDSAATVYGGPFSGGSGKECNINIPLGAVFFLKRGETNYVRKLSSSEIAACFINNTIKYESQTYMNLLLRAIDTLIPKADFYELVCTPDERAVDCVCSALGFKE